MVGEFWTSFKRIHTIMKTWSGLLSPHSAFPSLELRLFLFKLCSHSSELRGLCSTKSSSEMLQNLLYFMYKKTHVVFFVFNFMQLYIFTLWMPWSMLTYTRAFIRWKCKVARNEKRFSWVFLYIKYSKFWSISLEHFVERKPFISEEWYVYVFWSHSKC